MSNLSLFRTLITAVLLAVSALPAAAQAGNGKKPVRYPFAAHDRINSYIRSSMKTQYFVGEPIIIPLVLVNHSRFPLTIETNFNPVSMLTVTIRPQGQSQRRYNGPMVLKNAYYPPVPLYLYPLEEHEHKFILWADADMPDGLAIAEPGTYTIDVSIRFGIAEGGAGGEMQPTGGTFTIEVLPTPEPLKPMVDLLKKDRNVIFLNLFKAPPSLGEGLLDVLKQYPNTVFTPYLTYALADAYAAQYYRRPSRETADAALLYYSITTQMDTPFRQDAFMDLLSLLDKLGLGEAIRMATADMVKHLPPDRQGRVGDLPVIQKYLPHLKELDPVKYWAFLP